MAFYFVVIPPAAIQPPLPFSTSQGISLPSTPSLGLQGNSSVFPSSFFLRVKQPQPFTSLWNISLPPSPLKRLNPWQHCSSSKKPIHLPQASRFIPPQDHKLNSIPSPSSTKAAHTHSSPLKQHKDSSPPNSTSSSRSIHSPLGNQIHSLPRH